ncbi:MAG: hypothetical protein LC808_06830, partial [Actinobacteria bacterium]|nr:hypothetical protein [Actinomycetota bacterium]
MPQGGQFSAAVDTNDFVSVSDVPIAAPPTQVVDPTNTSRWSGPFAPLPLQEPHRYYEPVRQPAPHRYS